MADRIKLMISVVLVALAIGAFYYLSNDFALLYRVLGLLVVVAISVAIAIQTELGRATWSFFKESRTEVRKVVWPTRRETGQTTLLIMLGVFIVGIFLWLLDMGLLAIVKLFTGQGS